MRRNTIRLGVEEMDLPGGNEVRPMELDRLEPLDGYTAEPLDRNTGFRNRLAIPAVWAITYCSDGWLIVSFS